MIYRPVMPSLARFMPWRGPRREIGISPISNPTFTRDLGGVCGTFFNFQAVHAMLSKYFIPNSSYTLTVPSNSSVHSLIIRAFLLYSGEKKIPFHLPQNVFIAVPSETLLNVHFQPGRFIPLFAISFSRSLVVVTHD